MCKMYIWLMTTILKQKKSISSASQTIPRERNSVYFSHLYKVVARIWVVTLVDCFVLQDPDPERIEWSSSSDPGFGCFTYADTRHLPLFGWQLQCDFLFVGQFLRQTNWTNWNLHRSRVQVPMPKGVQCLTMLYMLAVAQPYTLCTYIFRILNIYKLASHK